LKYSGSGSLALGSVAVLMLLAIGSAACSDRERANPFDPLSPDYGGMGGLNAFAGNQRVYLYWGQLSYTDLAGFDILRVSLADQDTSVLNDTTLTAEEVDFMDVSARNGTTYAYSLRLLLIGSDELPTTVPDLATPGHTFGWLVTDNGTKVTYTTPDFRDALYSLDGDFLQVGDIQLTPDQKEIWVLDRGYDKISRFRLSGEPLEDNPVFSNTAGFAFDYQNNSLWIAVNGSEGLLYHFDANGMPAASYRTGVWVTSLAVDYPGRGVWVGSSDGRVVGIHNGEMNQYEHGDFSRPELVAAGQSGIVWVLDIGQKTLFHIDKRGQVQRLGTYTDPVDIATDYDGSTCWVAEPAGDILHEINLNASIVGKVENLGQPWRLTYDPVDNAVYVSGAAGKVSKVGPGGKVFWQIDYPNYPGKIALEYRK